MKKLALLGSLALISTAVHANDPSPHFYVVMDNQSDKNVSISFRKEAGQVWLVPSLPDNTKLAAHQKSQPYGVVYPVIGTSDPFSIIFTGNKDCAVRVEFFAPGKPKITMEGYGCIATGYSIVGNQLILQIKDIDLKKKA